MKKYCWIEILFNRANYTYRFTGLSYVQCIKSLYCFEKLSSVCFLLSFPPAMGGSNVSNPIPSTTETV